MVKMEAGAITQCKLMEKKERTAEIARTDDVNKDVVLTEELENSCVVVGPLEFSTTGRGQQCVVAPVAMVTSKITPKRRNH